MLDKKRYTALTLSGYKVISITFEQIKNFRNIENVFSQIRELLGMRQQKDRMDKYFEERWNLVNSVLQNK